MRWYQITALALLAFVAAGLLVASDEKKQDAQRFKVTFTITYNQLTLAEAAELEKVVREQHAKACAVVVGVESLVSTPTVWWGNVDSVFKTLPIGGLNSHK